MNAQEGPQNLECTTSQWPNVPTSELKHGHADCAEDGEDSAALYARPRADAPARRRLRRGRGRRGRRRGRARARRSRRVGGRSGRAARGRGARRASRFGRRGWGRVRRGDTRAERDRLGLECGGGLLARRGRVHGEDHAGGAIRARGGEEPAYCRRLRSSIKKYGDRMMCTRWGSCR